MDARAVDLLTRTILGEAAGQGDVGQAAVAHVVNNRLNSGRFGKSIEDVLFAPKQFEPWDTRRRELEGYGPQTKGWGDAEAIARMVLGGQLPDPTNGATHFANVGTVQQRGNTAGMRWINQMLGNGSAMKIGAHTFGTPDSQPGATGGARAPSLRYGTQTGGRNAALAEPSTISPQRQAIRALMAEILADLDLSALAGPPGAAAPPPGPAMSAQQGQGALPGPSAAPPVAPLSADAQAAPQGTNPLLETLV